jgi:uncharacterized membrane protein
MSDQIPADITSDDKLWALLSYILTPIVPIIVLLMEEKKNRPYLRAHTIQALVAGVVFMILNFILFWTGCVPLLTLGVCIYWGIEAYNGKYVTIPLITDFCKQQGWS